MRPSAPASAAVFVALACAAVARAQGEAIPPPPDAAAAAADLAARLGELEVHLARLEQKIDRLEELLHRIYGEKIRRAEMLAADPAAAAAIRAVESRYRVRGITDALISDDPEKLVALHRALSRAASGGDVRAFARDPDVAALLAAMAGRPEFLAESGGTLVVALTGRDLEATRDLSMALLARPEQGAQEAALWAAVRARAPEAAPRLVAFARAVDPASATLGTLAAAAAAAAGDSSSVARLLSFVRSDQIARAFVYRLANELAAAGSPVAFRLYVELLDDRQYVFAAAQAFSRIQGFERPVVGWREAKEDRDKLRGEFSAWLDAHWARLAWDEARSEFTIGGAGRR